MNIGVYVCRLFLPNFQFLEFSADLLMPHHHRCRCFQLSASATRPSHISIKPRGEGKLELVAIFRREYAWKQKRQQYIAGDNLSGSVSTYSKNQVGRKKNVRIERLVWYQPYYSFACYFCHTLLLYYLLLAMFQNLSWLAATSGFDQLSRAAIADSFEH